MESSFQVQLPSVRGKGLVGHVVFPTDLCLTPRAANYVFICFIMMYMGVLELKTRATGDGACENCISVQAWVPSSQGLAVLVQTALQ